MEILTLRGILLLCAVTQSAVCGMSTNTTEVEHRISTPCSSDEYRLNNRCCQKCPAGTYVVTHCSKNHGLGHCRNCTTGKSFTAFPNGLGVCLPCLSCREDEDLVEECTVTKNTGCQCKFGTYLCTANMNCSDAGVCLRCTEAQSIRQECAYLSHNSTMDSRELALIITSGIICTSLTTAGIYFFMRKRRKRQGANTSPEGSDRRTATENGSSDGASGIEAPDVQDSVNSNTRLILEQDGFS